MFQFGGNIYTTGGHRASNLLGTVPITKKFVVKTDSGALKKKSVNFKGL